MKHKQPILYLNQDSDFQNKFAEKCKTYFLVHPAKNIKEAENIICRYPLNAVVADFQTLKKEDTKHFHYLIKREKNIPVIISLDFSDPITIKQVINHSSAFVYMDTSSSITEMIEKISQVIEQSKNTSYDEDLLIEKNTEILKLKKELSVVNDNIQIKSAFIANLSHEIRTPLNAIIGFSQLIQNRDLPKEQLNTYHDIIEKGINNLFSLLEDIMLMAKIDNQQLTCRENPTYIKEFFTLFYNEIKYNPSYQTKPDVDILVPRFFEEDICFYTDSRKLKDILHRLVNNAYKFTEEGTIEVGYNISTHTDHHIMHFFVKDTGKGIPIEKLNLIFDRFNKLETRQDKLYKGLGIGLTISQALARIIKAKITVESEIEKGSTFMVSIPFRACHEKK